jgi:hypothetical protein
MAYEEDEGVSGQTDVPAKTKDAITWPANASTAPGTLWAAFSARGPIIHAIRSLGALSRRANRRCCFLPGKFGGLA